MCLVYAVCRTDNAGNKFEQEIFDNSGIKVGDKIRLLEANVGGWHTDVYLEGYDKKFNSVFFNYEDKNGDEYNIYRKPGFYEFYKEI